MTYTKKQMEFLDAAAIAAMRAILTNLNIDEDVDAHEENLTKMSFDFAEALLAERTRCYESVKEVQP